MKQFSVIFNNKTYFFDPKKPLNLAIELVAGNENPNCYYAENPVFETIKADNFIGSVAQGGSCNYQKIMLTPHGNGTHTECYGHISADENATVSKCFNENLFVAQLVTLTPKPRILIAQQQDFFTKHNMENSDLIVYYEDFMIALEGKEISEIEAIIIRTLPNSIEKKTKKYSNTNPPYLDFRICKYLADNNITHLLLDLPSVDKEVDGGELKAHKAFWQMSGNQQDNQQNNQQDNQQDIRKNAGITEMIFVDNEIKDGLYLLDLQILRMNIDAVPSKPILYELYQ